MPSDKGARHALAAALSSGLIPAHTVARFDGQHGDLQLASQRPALCVCRTKPIPAAPSPVRFHGKNGYRELHGGRLPVVGAQIMRVKPSEIIPADLFRAEKDVCHIQPKNALQSGEYAVMIAGALLPHSACRSALAVPLRSVIFPLLRLPSPAVFFFLSAPVANHSSSFLYTKSLWSFVCEGAACPLRS